MAGEVFKKRREELGIDIKEASNILKIGSEYLNAIENDIFDRLPVAVYTIGYIRCYAKYLDVDAEPVIASFTSHLTSPKPSTIIPVSSSMRKVPGYTYFALAFLAGLLIFAVYVYISKNRVSDQSAENIRISRTERPPVPLPPLNAGNEYIKISKDNVASESRLPVAAQTPEGKKEHHLIIVARDTVWVQIRHENGKLDEALLKSGMSKDWSFAGSAVLKIGNAGGLTLNYDGKDLGMPGNPGQVLNLNFPPDKVSTETENTAKSSQQ